MCFIKHYDHFHAKTAEKDIICYKIVTKNKNGLYTPYRGVKINYEEKVEAKIKNWDSDDHIHIGIHSCSTFGSALKRKFNMLIGYDDCARGNKIIVKCIIPKGSEYFYNPSDKEYISDCMIYGNKREFLI